MHKTYKAMNVAKFIIDYYVTYFDYHCSEMDENGNINCNCNISVFRLNCLLYFIQAYYLIEIGRKCFDDDIEAWGFGPVVFEVYKEFSRFGCNPIILHKSTVNRGLILDSVEWERFDDDLNVLASKDKKIICKVIDSVAKYSTQYLQQVIRNQQPWKAANKCFDDKVISIDSIKKYFQ